MPPKVDAAKGKCPNPSCGRTKTALNPATGLCNGCTSAQAMVTGVQATPNLASLSSFPMVALSHVKVDNATINSVCDDFNADNDIDEGDYKKAVFGMLANLCLSVNNFESKLEEVKKDVANNSDRIKALEDKIGDRKECSVPLSIAIQKIPKPAIGMSDLELVKDVIRRVNAEGVNSEEDVVKVSRKGFKPANGTQSERQGTYFVEMKSTEAKAKVMRAKKSLANLPNMKDVRISNMKTQHEMNQDFFNRQLLRMVQGGNQWYISGNGTMRPVTQQPGRQGPAPYAQPQGPPATFNPTTLPPSYQTGPPPARTHGQA